MSWRALIAYVAHAPRESALFRVAGPADAQWGPTEQLLALIGDLTQTLVWFKSKDGQKGQNRPKPIPRPGQQQIDADRNYGRGTVMSLDEARAWQKQRREGAIRPMTLAEEVS